MASQSCFAVVITSNGANQKTAWILTDSIHGPSADPVLPHNSNPQRNDVAGKAFFDPTIEDSRPANQRSLQIRFLSLSSDRKQFPPESPRHVLERMIADAQFLLFFQNDERDTFSTAKHSE
jgi:hypothetical protein